MTISATDQQDELRQIMRENKLSRQDVADMVCQGRVHTVISWLRKDRHRRTMPMQKLELLKLLIEGRKKEHEEIM